MSPPVIVLDTHIVFDWLLFGDAESGPLKAALESGELRWIATLAMRTEHFEVLGRGHLDRWHPDLAALNAAWDTHCSLVPCAPRSTAAGPIPQCSDVDDQKFIDLALSHRAHWLISKDRAVLKLARPMRLLGVEVMTAAAWAESRVKPASSRSADRPIANRDSPSADEAHADNEKDLKP